MYSVILAVKIFSKSFPSIGSREMGLYEVGFEPGLLGFRIMLINEVFQALAKYPRSREAQCADGSSKVKMCPDSAGPRGQNTSKLETVGKFQAIH